LIKFRIHKPQNITGINYLISV